MNLSKHIKISFVQTYLLSADTDHYSNSVDMSGFDGVLFIGTMGTQAASAIAKIRGNQSDDNSSFDFIDAEIATLMDDVDNDKFLALDIYRPEKRYVRTRLERSGSGGNTEWLGTLALQYNSFIKPTKHDVLTLAGESLAISPIEVPL